MRQPDSGRAALSFAIIALGGCHLVAPDPDVSGGSSPPGNGAVTRATHAPFFPIEAGVHGNADCNSCHGGFGSFKEFSCITCHEHARPVADMQHAGIQGYQYDAKSCLGCHPSGQASGVSRTDHSAKFFPIAVGPHAAGQCADCHKNQADFKQFDCLSCHEHDRAPTDAKHPGIAGYAYDSPACLKCHPAGTGASISRADHSASFFPIATGAHSPAACSSCHSDSSNFKQFDCLSCHEHDQAVLAPKHANVTGYSYDSPSCLRCHQSGTATFDHAKLGAMPNCIGCHQSKLAAAVTTPASNHVTNGFPKACEACHKSFTAWGPGTAMPHAAVGNTAAKCETCHLDTFTKAVAPFNHAKQNALPAACNSCHKDFVSWLKFAHPSNCFNGTTLRGHEGATCAQCHTVATDYKQSSCTACHRNRGTNCND